MQQLLTATDLSVRAGLALDRALQLADQHDAELRIIHVIDSGLAASGQQERNARQAISAHLSARDYGGKATIEVVVGEPHQEILRKADECGVELIILGASRRGRGDDGSTAWQVLREGTQPVLLVQRPALAPYRRLLVGFDFSGYSEAALRMAFHFHPDQVHVVHAYHVPFEGFAYGADTRDQVRRQYEQDLSNAVHGVVSALGPGAAAVELHRRVCRGEAREILRQECQNISCDLLALGTRGRTGLAHMIFGSVAKDLLRDPPCDLLAIRSQTTSVTQPLG